MSSSSLIVDYLGVGTAAARPATPNLATGAFGWYYASDTGALSVWTGAAWATPAGSGTVTTTGSPSSGKLTKFSGATSVTTADLTGDVTTSGGLATTVANANYSATLTATGTPVTTSLGYLGAPQNIQNADYTLVLTDTGKHLYHTSGSTHTWTIPANGSVAYPIGTVIALVNENGGGNVTVAITTDTLRWGSSTGSRTLAANGTATIMKVASTTWRMTGDGIT